MTDLRRATRTRGLTFIGVALLLDLAAIVGWWTAFYGPFPPHPWIFLLLAVLSLACGLAGTILGSIGYARDPKQRWWGVAAIALGVIPLVVLLIVYVLAGFGT